MERHGHVHRTIFCGSSTYARGADLLNVMVYPAAACPTLKAVEGSGGEQPGSNRDDAKLRSECERLHNEADESTSYGRSGTRWTLARIPLRLDRPAVFDEVVCSVCNMSDC